MGPQSNQLSRLGTKINSNARLSAPPIRMQIIPNIEQEPPRRRAPFCLSLVISERGLVLCYVDASSLGRVHHAACSLLRRAQTNPKKSILQRFIRSTCSKGPLTCLLVRSCGLWPVEHPSSSPSQWSQLGWFARGAHCCCEIENHAKSESSFPFRHLSEAITTNVSCLRLKKANGQTQGARCNSWLCSLRHCCCKGGGRRCHCSALEPGDPSESRRRR